MPGTNLANRTIRDLLGALESGATTSEELLCGALARIQDPRGEGERAFVRVYRDQALAQARSVDAARRAGESVGPLAGIPLSIKDLFDVQGEATLAGSRALIGAAPATRDAEIVRRLRSAGAILVGKTNMTEFAYSATGINGHCGTPRNPFDRAAGRIPGGSSSGAAVSVTDGMAVAAIGTDTGGSVRIPAAFCGIVGFKPTAFRIPRDGCVPLSTTLDSIGPLANSVDCCARVDSVLAGDRYLAPEPPDLKSLRIGFVTDYVLDGLELPVAHAMERARSLIERGGVRVADAPFPELSEIVGLNRTGGFAGFEAWQWHQDLIGRNCQAYDQRVLAAIEKHKGMTEREYRELIVERQRIISRAALRFASFDALAWPVTPLVAPPIGALIADDKLFRRVNALAMRNTNVTNFLDGCAISLPCHEPSTLPVGIMLSLRHGEDRRLINIAASLEPLLVPT